MKAHKDLDIITRAWQRFVDKGELYGGISPVILRSWIRSKNNQISRCQGPDKLHIVKDHGLKNLKKAHADSLEASETSILALTEALYNRDMAILLSDPEGNILQVTYTRDGSDILKGFKPGQCLAEGIAGTNCIGLASLEKKPVSVWGAEHYNSLWHRLFGEAAPIFTKQGELKGIIALMGDIADKQPGYNHLVYMLARRIEDQLEIWEYKKMWRLGSSVLRLTAKTSFMDLKGESKKWKDVIKSAKRAAEGSANLHLTGGQGVGKETLARAIHFENSKGPFVQFDCMKNSTNGRLFLNSLQLAQHGVLFIKNINYLPKKMQLALLKACRQKTFVDVYGKTKEREFRIFSSSTENLEKMVNQKLFDEDLYYRLSGHHIFIAPLQERIQDIECLLAHRLETLVGKKKSLTFDVSEEAWIKLKAHSWPGNVSELFNVINQAVERLGDNTVIAAKHIII
ncbi:sigma-54-dependent Fis family transcriptional regulator [Desulfitibacter alkalitolerans]|uniref:sigma-54-dependent Fis family transcriptional regulator n=1 Tax=Desulfitibacter alkalitolerans TaxID=264641 RepID=UPI0004813F4B|nr:sigma 54-interacting transcriptional regulator [Desulfitibacter alkalitolerans]